ncbi:MAG: helix-turn-helix transcriptional regulator [Desulfobacteraceae bacterium]|jgi:poly-beta-hydroxybutyrate-responsive repressor
MSRKTKSPRRSGSKKRERYIQPSILLALKQKPSYGYELIQQMPQFGFIRGQAPPGMIYRHLRELEDNGLVLSEWETEGAGPAKRVYQLTEEGLEVLEFWIGYMKDQSERLMEFIEMYQAVSNKGAGRK